MDDAVHSIQIFEETVMAVSLYKIVRGPQIDIAQCRRFELAHLLFVHRRWKARALQKRAQAIIHPAGAGGIPFLGHVIKRILGVFGKAEVVIAEIREYRITGRTFGQAVA
ncbi:MAG: hypothetical protein C4519_26490 [Desulfobacteraceae bacterium]|nr:MAG: hypothetical protein C4519_26490 [Desulfobacteraceae bacterium]